MQIQAKIRSRSGRGIPRRQSADTSTGGRTRGPQLRSRHPVQSSSKPAAAAGTTSRESMETPSVGSGTAVLRGNASIRWNHHCQCKSRAWILTGSLRIGHRTHHSRARPGRRARPACQRVLLPGPRSAVATTGRTHSGIACRMANRFQFHCRASHLRSREALVDPYLRGSTRTAPRRIQSRIDSKIGMVLSIPGRQLINVTRRLQRVWMCPGSSVPATEAADDDRS